MVGKVNTLEHCPCIILVQVCVPSLMVLFIVVTSLLTEKLAV